MKWIPLRLLNTEAIWKLFKPTEHLFKTQCMKTFLVLTQCILMWVSYVASRITFCQKVLDISNSHIYSPITMLTAINGSQCLAIYGMFCVAHPKSYHWQKCVEENWNKNQAIQYISFTWKIYTVCLSFFMSCDSVFIHQVFHVLVSQLFLFQICQHLVEHFFHIIPATLI